MKFHVFMHIVRSSRDVTSSKNCTCLQVRRISRAVTQFFDEQIRQLRPTQTPILNALHATGEWSMAERSDFLGMERTTLLRNLRPLERDGLAKSTGGGHGGHVTLSITAKGRAAVAKTLPAWRSSQDRVVSVLAAERWEAILSDLDTVTARLHEH